MNFKIKELLNNALLKTTFAYTLTDGLNRALGFILIPWVSFYIIPSELGIVANYLVFFNILILLAGSALVNSMPYFFYKRAKQDIAIHVSNLLFIIVLFSVLFIGIIYLFSTFIESYLQIGIVFQLLAIATVVTTLISNLNLVLFRLEENVKGFISLQIVQMILNLLLVVSYVIILHWGAAGKIYSLVQTSLIVGIINLLILRRRGYIIFKLSSKSIKETLRFGLPLLPHSLSFWLKDGVDKIMITSFCGLAMNGLYSMALSISSVFALFSTAFNNAYCPYLQKRISEFDSFNLDSEKRMIVNQAYKLAVIYVVLWFAAIIFAWICFNFVVSKKYIEAFQYAPWLLLGQMFNGFYYLVVQYIYNAKKTFGLGSITFTISLFQVFLSYLLIRRIGVQGAALSTCIGSLFIFLFVWRYSAKVFPMPWFYFLRKH